MLILRADLVMPEIKRPILETGARLSCLLTAPCGVLKENLRRHCENARVGKPTKQRAQESSIHDHVIVQENNRVRGRFCNAPIVAFGKSVVAVKCQDLNRRKVFANELDTAVFAAVVDNKNIVAASIMSNRLDDRRQTFGQ